MKTIARLMTFIMCALTVSAFADVPPQVSATPNKFVDNGGNLRLAPAAPVPTQPVMIPTNAAGNNTPNPSGAPMPPAGAIVPQPTNAPIPKPVNNVLGNNNNLPTAQPMQSPAMPTQSVLPQGPIVTTPPVSAVNAGLTPSPSAMQEGSQTKQSVSSPGIVPIQNNAGMESAAPSTNVVPMNQPRRSAY